MLLRVFPLLSALMLWLASSSQAALFVAAPPAPTAAPSTPENASTAILLNESELRIGLLVGNDPLDKTDPMGLSEIVIDITRTESNIQARSGVPQATTGGFTMSVRNSSQAFASVSGVTLEPPRQNFNMNKQAGVTKQYPVPGGTYSATASSSGPTAPETNFKLEGVKGFSGVYVHSGSNAQSTEGCVLVGCSVGTRNYTPGGPQSDGSRKAGIDSSPTLEGSSAKMNEMGGLYNQVRAADKAAKEETTIKVIIRNGN